MGSDYSTSLIVNLSDKSVYYGVIKNKMVKDSKTISTEGVIGVGSGVQTAGGIGPSLNFKGSQSTTFIKNKSSDCCVKVPPGGDQRLGLKSKDKVPVGSQLEVSVGEDEKSQIVTLTKGFQAYQISKQYCLNEMTRVQLIDYCDWKLKTAKCIDGTVKNDVMKVVDEYFEDNELQILEQQGQFDLVDKIIALKDRLKKK